MRNRSHAVMAAINAFVSGLSIMNALSNWTILTKWEVLAAFFIVIGSVGCAICEIRAVKD